MDFITENYLWIIIFIIIILMAVVGYIADKTEFIKKSEAGAKTKKAKEKKPKEKKHDEQPIVIEDKGIDELLQKATKKSSKSKEKEEKVVEPEVTPLNDDIKSPLVSEPVNEDNTAVDESLFAPLESTEVSDTEINNELNPVEVTSLENIETTDAPVVNEEEDIWKF